MDVSLDIETLHDGSDSVVLAIGACAFDQDSIGNNTFFRVLNIQEQIDVGRKISERTLIYWFDKSKEAQAAMFGFQKRSGVVNALVALRDWWQLDLGNAPRFMFSKGPGFDAAIMQNLSQQFGMETPWHFTKQRCVRTLNDVLTEETMPKFVGIPHHPLHDAVFQAQCIQAAWRRLPAPLRGTPLLGTGD